MVKLSATTRNAWKYVINIACCYLQNNVVINTLQRIRIKNLYFTSIFP